MLIMLPWAGACATAAPLQRDLACDTQDTQRAQSICQALERDMHWEWFGHAVVSPGYRVNFETVRSTYCRLPIRAADSRILVNMVLDAYPGSGDTRVVQRSNGARWLLFLLGDAALANFPSSEALARPEMAADAEALRQEVQLNIGDPAMIWHQSHPHYLLRAGCP